MWLFVALMAQAEPIACRQAHDAFARFTSRCAVSADCDVYYLRGNCEKPTALSKSAYEKLDKGILIRMQAQLRKECPQPAVACAPRPATAVCKANRCVVR